MRYHIEWSYLSSDNSKVFYLDEIRNWSLTLPPALSLARRMGNKIWGEWGHEVVVTQLDKDPSRNKVEGRLL